MWNHDIFFPNHLVIGNTSSPQACFEGQVAVHQEYERQSLGNKCAPTYLCLQDLLASDHMCITSTHFQRAVLHAQLYILVDRITLVHRGI